MVFQSNTSKTGKIMNKYILMILVSLGLLVTGKFSYGQFEWGLSDISLAATDAKWGLPFVELYPIHPGFELGTHFLTSEKEFTSHRFGVQAGYFDHSVIAHALYLQAGYEFQIRIRQIIGFDLGAGAGYCHAIYPGDGYIFNEDTGLYESGTDHEGFFSYNARFGISLVKYERIQPFVRYDLMVLEKLYNQCTLLQLGVRIRLN